MTLVSGIFGSVAGDRRYKAAFFAQYFASFISNGVFPNPATGMQVVANGDMTVTIKAGQAWINGYYLSNDADYILQLDVADGVLKRIDKIVLRLDYSGREIIPMIKKGAFSSTPVVPSLQRDADAYELGIANVQINNGVVSIVQSNITDLRLDTVNCGIVHGVVDQVDTTEIFNQYQAWFDLKKVEYDQDLINWSNQERADFNTWSAQERADFDAWLLSIKDALSGDVAANLQAQIDELVAKGDGIVQQATPPAGAVEGDLWLDTSDDVFQGTVLDGIEQELNLVEQNLLTHIDSDIHHGRFIVNGIKYQGQWVPNEDFSGMKFVYEEVL